MRLLDRYLLRELLVPLAYCMAGFLMFYVAFDLIFKINRFQEAHLHFTDVTAYYLVTVPEFLVFPVIPVSLLLALLYALTNHSRHHELIAMRAAGVGLGRLSVPYLAVGVLLGLVVFAINELWVPKSADQARNIMQRRQSHSENRDWVAKLDFQNETAGRQWSIARYNRVTSEMVKPVIVWSLPDHSRREIYAEHGIYAGGRWVFSNVVELDTPAGQTNPSTTRSNAVLALSFPETPAWIQSELTVESTLANPTETARRPQLSIRQILDYRRLHRLHSEQRASLMTQLQCRLAEPFTCLAVVLIALPFGVRTGRHNVFGSVAGSIFICFAYFIMQRICQGLGVGGTLPPFLAAWLPNLTFGLTGLVLLWKVR